MGPSEWTAARWALSHGEVAGRPVDDAAQCAISVPSVADARAASSASIGLRPGAADAVGRGRAHRPRRCSIRRRSPSSARCSSAMRPRRRPPPKASDCAQPCCRRSRMICARRSPRSSAPSPACAASATRCRRRRATICSRRSRRRRAGLSRFVANLLDMTRLESAALDLKRDWVDLGDIVRAAVGARPQGLAGPPARCRDRGRAAARPGRQRAARAGGVQSSRQCQQICRSRHADARRPRGAKTA